LISEGLIEYLRKIITTDIEEINKNRAEDAQIDLHFDPQHWNLMPRNDSENLTEM